jgi:DNA mismatch endonuclease (patch repair protein)
MDNLTKKQRSHCMSLIRSADTKPEMIVRSLVHQMGYRYSLHKKNLPGQPDIVLARHHKIILVHGCFWHMHCCRYGRVKPKTNTKYWEKKRSGNVIHHRKAVKMLRDLGWDVFVIWECQTRDPKKLIPRLQTFLKS